MQWYPFLIRLGLNFFKQKLEKSVVCIFSELKLQSWNEPKFCKVTDTNPGEDTKKGRERKHITKCPVRVNSSFEPGLLRLKLLPHHKINIIIHTLTIMMDKCHLFYIFAHLMCNALPSIVELWILLFLMYLII